MNYENLYNETELEAIEELAAHGFTVEQIDCIIPKKNECSSHVTLNLLLDKNSFLNARYEKGFLESELKIRQRIFLDAQHGSSPAQALAVKILDAAAFKRDNHD